MGSSIGGFLSSSHSTPTNFPIRSSDTAVESTANFSVSSFGFDRVNPSVLDFSLDLASNSLTFFFNDIMDFHSTNMSLVSLSYCTGESFEIIDTVLSNYNGSSISFNLSDTSLFLLQSNPPVCVSQATCFVSVLQNAFADVFSNPSDRLQARMSYSFIPDNTSPRLESSIQETI